MNRLLPFSLGERRMSTIVPFILMVLVILVPASASAQMPAGAASAESADGAALVDRLRRGGLVMFIRHADTAGEACDAYGRTRDRQRNISGGGREQAAALGQCRPARTGSWSGTEGRCR
jgi:hypothetical protein